ncbi:TetR/AcrR family transcriptional regulator C-terminal domain-containing protein [Hydrogenophaga sp. 5NK40-0174]|uniref:TetR/AcrR family transcriptional regulator C-terminal domain-containing protein n=1 Tax=Hydrogenophaga sp. 5NK40-0174 TaxID=3127649 RepID=UPI00310A9781
MAAGGKSRGKGAGGSSASDDHQRLSKDRVAQAAVELLDAHGIKGFSMRKLAEHLGSGVMSVYWHVANKEAVYDLALDTVLAYKAERPIPARGATHPNWSDRVLDVLVDWRACMLRHPWSAPLLPQRMLGHSTLARLEILAQALIDGGVPEKEIKGAIWSLWNHLMGATLTLVSFMAMHEPDGSANPKEAPPVAGATAYPSLERLDLLADDDWDGAFEAGIRLILRGVTAHP